MYIDKLMNKFGYSEMYEWSELFEHNIVPYGRFVTFDKKEPGKIRLANKEDYPIGVTTINSVITSDDPEEWQAKYICNEYGDIFLKEKDKAVAVNAYDDINEMPYVATYKDIDVVPVINDDFDKKKEYIKRSNRPEWIRVHLLGKCIVVDDGTCQPGQLCTIGENGTAVPAETTNNWPYVNKFIVIDRLTENTIMIFFK